MPGPVSGVVPELDSTVSSRLLLELVRAAERAGASRAEFLRAASIAPERLEADELRIPRSEVFRLCQVALDVTGDPALGLHWGEWLASNAFNVVSHLLVHAATLRQALESLRRFGPLLADEIRLELIENGSTAELRSLEALDEPLTIQRFVDEMVALGFLRLIQHFAGQDQTAARVCFRYPAPEYRREYARIFAGGERFDQPFTGLVFDGALLSLSSPQKDEDLHATLSDVAERRLMQLQSRAPYAVHVRNYLVRQPSPHRVAMQEVARSLGLSVRSLHRRLAEEGQSYPELAIEASAHVAKRLLLEELHTIQSTAHAMGFSNVSAFHRAFRRWTSTTPGALSRQHVNTRSTARNESS